MDKNTKYKPFLKKHQWVDPPHYFVYYPIYWDDGKLGGTHGIYDTVEDAEKAIFENKKFYEKLPWWKEFIFSWEIERVQKGIRVHNIYINWEEPLEEWPYIPS